MPAIGHDIIISGMEYGDSSAETAHVLRNAGSQVWHAAPSRLSPCVASPLPKAWQWLGVSSLLLLFAAMWTVVKPYLGLVHDARLYALQTAARLKPDIFAGDLFLRYGSQDSFTVFPLLYAPLAQTLGLEHAAAVLTFVFATAWLALGFLIAREISGARLALLGTWPSCRCAKLVRRVRGLSDWGNVPQCKASGRSVRARRNAGPPSPQVRHRIGVVSWFSIDSPAHGHSGHRGD